MVEQSRPEAEIRLGKLDQLKKLGINPYPSATSDHIVIEEVRRKKDGTKVATVGRLTSIRKHGKIAFLDLIHEDEKIQLFCSIDNKEVFELIDLLDTGDYVWTEGELFTTKAGELTIKLAKLTLLAKALLPIPELWNGLEDVETRYRQRALDFKTNPEARKIIETRAKIINTLRTFLER
ncbi:MAG: OB-fold nucleic acid binding domain-containing protein, partial [Patescibacteria group bacterium]